MVLDQQTPLSYRLVLVPLDISIRGIKMNLETPDNVQQRLQSDVGFAVHSVLYSNLRPRGHTIVYASSRLQPKADPSLPVQVLTLSALS